MATFKIVGPTVYFEQGISNVVHMRLIRDVQVGGPKGVDSLVSLRNNHRNTTATAPAAPDDVHRFQKRYVLGCFCLKVFSDRQTVVAQSTRDSTMAI